MKCCSMKLANRSESQEFLLKMKERHCHSMILSNGDSCSRFSASNYKSSNQRDDPPQLSVLNISLPTNVKAFDAGTSLHRWTNKRPRLKSARNGFKSEPSLDNPNILNVSVLIEEFCHEYQLEEIVEDAPSISESLEEVHPDIRQLLEVTHEEADDKMKTESLNGKNPKRRSKGKHKKKKREKRERVEEVMEKVEAKKRVTKTVSFSLSKPPTPQTEQVIRVDIVTNYSIDVEYPENCNKAGKNNKKQEQLVPKIEKDALIELLSESNKREAKNLVVESKKVVLYQRDMDSNKNV